MGYSVRSTFKHHLLMGTALVAISLPAYAGPEGGVVTNGNAAISSSANTTIINQASERAIIRWNTFDVETNETVRFQQPSRQSITVNKIQSADPSLIKGNIQANGNVVLINPQGITFTEGSKVNVGGLVATTSSLKDDDEFMQTGRLNFEQGGNPNAKIINRGDITAADAGLVGLVASHVENSGVIRARLGQVSLASGDIHTIDMVGDGLIQLRASNDLVNQTIKNICE